MDVLKEIETKLGNLDSMRRNVGKEDILAALGLQSKNEPVDYVLPALGLFGAGLLVGAGLGLIMAPRPGRALRRELGKKMDQVTDRAKNALEEVRN
jgi:hypothetical protein